MALITNWHVPEEASTIRGKYRQTVASYIRDAIRIRVSQRGSGADGALKGYSSRPLVVEKGILKSKRKPARGWNSFHPGGYKQYRQELGLTSELFVFSNKGAAWRDWRFFPLVLRGPIAFGFASAANDEAAVAAVLNGRPDMFEPGDVEMDQAADLLLQELLDKIYGPG